VSRLLAGLPKKVGSNTGRIRFFFSAQIPDKFCGVPPVLYYGYLEKFPLALK
jgi:hypothetical protein